MINSKFIVLMFIFVLFMLLVAIYFTSHFTDVFLRQSVSETLLDILKIVAGGLVGFLGSLTIKDKI